MRVVEIFKGNKREEMYLFVDQKEGINQYLKIYWPHSVSRNR